MISARILISDQPDESPVGSAPVRASAAQFPCWCVSVQLKFSLSTG